MVQDTESVTREPRYTSRCEPRVIVVEIVSEKQGQHDHLEVPLGQPVSREQVVAPKSVAVESQVDRLELIPKLAARKATEATVDRHLIRFHERIADLQGQIYLSNTDRAGLGGLKETDDRKPAG